MIHTRSKENVKEYGEVFTPPDIVDKMNDLVSEKAWSDPEFCFLEPTCGNGNILVKIFEKRVANGISIEDALNTLIGMDISRQNIVESHFRLYECTVNQMKKENVIFQSNNWIIRAKNIIAIVKNNIFQVKDSIEYIKSKLENKTFVKSDPTGSGQIMSEKNLAYYLSRIEKQWEKPFKTKEQFKEQFKKYKNGINPEFNIIARESYHYILMPFFKK